MPILCEPAATAGGLISNLGSEVRTAEDLSTAAKLLDSDPAETLVVVGPQAPTEEAIGFASALRMIRPAVGVVLVRDEVTLPLLNQALQAGVREVVPAGDNAALAAACRRSRDVSWRLLAATTTEQSGSKTDGRIITVFTNKGGVGKTMLSVNLGAVLARRDGNRVCVVDLDLASGDVAINVLLDPARTMADAVPMAGRLDVTGAASLLTHYRANLDMLLAPVAPGDADKIPPSLVGELLAVLRRMYDYVVIDSPAHLNEHTLTALDASAHHVLVTTPDVPAMKNVRVVLDVLGMLSYPPEIRSLVLNRADPKLHLNTEDVEQVVGTEISAEIPASRAVPISVNKGVPITIDSPGHPVSQAITKFAEARILPPPAERGGLLRRTKRKVVA